MIDIHSHIIPSVDDGSNSLELSLSMLLEAYKEGISDVICTPHFMYDSIYNKFTKELNEPYQNLKQALIGKQVFINLHMGNELYIPDLSFEEIKNQKFHTLSDSKYVLVEFSFNTYKPVFDEMLYNLRAYGYKVIIAHPERYAYVLNDYKFINRWLEEGYYLQCNQEALFNASTKKFVFLLIEKGLLHFIASDAHSINRPVSLKKAYDVVSKRYGKEIAEQIFTTNPKLVLENKELLDMPIVSRKFLL